MKGTLMRKTVGAKITKRTKSKIQIEISKEGFEAFCDQQAFIVKNFSMR